MGAMPASPSGSTGRSALAWYLIVMFFGQTVFLSVFWSLFMSVWLGRNFASILVPAGPSFGLTMGIFFTALLAVLLRAGTVRVRVFDSAEFLDRLDRAAGKLRYRPLPRRDGAIAYEPRALVRTAATRIFVDLGEAEAVMTGPKLTLDRLRKEIERPRS
jgi:hypothetical protein